MLRGLAGTAGIVVLRAPLARALHAEGVSVLLFDYRGYGGNPGSPTEEGLAMDVRAAHRFLVDDADIPAGLILRSPFVDLPSVAAVHYPFLPTGVLLRDRFPLAERIARLDVPTTVVYGTADTIVPPGQSRAVADAAAHLVRAVEVPGADHNDPVLLDGADVVRAVLDLAR